MSTTNAKSHNEAIDAERVGQAVQAYQRGDDATAEALLLEVVGRAPATYVYQFEDASGLNIKFWDRAEFMHYVAWMKDNGAERHLTWFSSAYPRAFYHLGFLRVKAKRYAEAVDFLDRGSALEPTNPKFSFEKAMALMQMRRFDQALALFEKVSKVGPHVSPNDVARALRGRGAISIEAGQLDRAEAAFRESLRWEPESKVTLNELLYIAQLRRGMGAAPSEITTSSGTTAGKCAVCGREFTKGTLATVKGKSVFVCETCQMTESKSKKWWEVWK
ncbi:MAG: tetratricopeptide repeat protein [Verrucomicrobiota bacterium]